MAIEAAAVRSVGELAGLVRAGGRAEYLMFWGHRPSADGAAGPGCLSQWWPVTFLVGGLSYPSAEHYMMAAKARLFGDAESAERIRRAAGPAAAKALGRQVTGFDEERWAAGRLDVVVTGNLAKFGQHGDLRQFLLSTGDRVLVEASPSDTVWGIGMDAADERATSPDRWTGLNLLGFALMEVRQRLRTGPPAG
jgi:ribA/ribD-fused uncharacterized protein